MKKADCKIGLRVWYGNLIVGTVASEPHFKPSSHQYYVQVTLDNNTIKECSLLRLQPIT